MPERPFVGKWGDGVTFMKKIHSTKAHYLRCILGVL